MGRYDDEVRAAVAAHLGPGEHVGYTALSFEASQPDRIQLWAVTPTRAFVFDRGPTLTPRECIEFASLDGLQTGYQAQAQAQALTLYRRGQQSTYYLRPGVPDIDGQQAFVTAFLPWLDGQVRQRTLGPINHPPPQGMSPAVTTGVQWKWGYSRWVGVHYGPIPVGIIIAVIVLIAINSH